MAQSNRETMRLMGHVPPRSPATAFGQIAMEAAVARLQDKMDDAVEFWRATHPSSCPGCGAPVQDSGCDYCGRGRAEQRQVPPPPTESMRR